MTLIKWTPVKTINRDFDLMLDRIFNEVWNNYRKNKQSVDVIENENKSFNDIKIDENFNYLLNCDNVILTPHIAGLSKEANRKLSEVLIKKILELK